MGSPYIEIVRTVGLEPYSSPSIHGEYSYLVHRAAAFKIVGVRDEWGACASLGKREGLYAECLSRQPASPVAMCKSGELKAR